MADTPETRGHPVTGADLGFFSKPFIASSGPDKGKVVKVYKGKLGREEAKETVMQHDSFVETLRKIGVRVPDTTARIVEFGNAFRLEIVQEPFNHSEHAREIIRKSPPEECSKIMLGIMSDAIKVIAHNLKTKGGIGFHPSLRNYFFRDGTAYFVDTFPPMAGGRKAVSGMIAKQVAGSRFGRGFVRLASPMIIHEYYNPKIMLLGILSSSLRIRPDLRAYLMREAREFFSGNTSGSLRKRLLRKTNTKLEKNLFSKIISKLDPVVKSRRRG